MRRNKVRWYEFEFEYSDKKRPVLILARDSIIGYLNEVMVAPIISTVRNIPSEVHLTRVDSMLKSCTINLDHLQTVSKFRIGELTTMLGPDKMKEAQTALLFAPGFDY